MMNCSVASRLANILRALAPPGWVRMNLVTSTRLPKRYTSTTSTGLRSSAPAALRAAAAGTVDEPPLPILFVSWMQWARSCGRDTALSQELLWFHCVAATQAAVT